MQTLYHVTEDTRDDGERHEYVVWNKMTATNV